MPSGSTCISAQAVRDSLIGAVSRTLGSAPLMSMTTAPRPSAPLPPTCSILPGRYMAAVAALPNEVGGRMPAFSIDPAPVGSMKYIWRLETPNTRPSGATHWRG